MQTTKLNMFILLPILLIFLFIFLLSRNHKPGHRRLPGPKGLPFIGNIHQLDISKLHICLTNLSKSYGPLFLLNFCQLPVVVISSADAAKKALKDNDIAFAGRPYSSASLKISYDQSDIITTSYSDYWRKMRKMVVQHLFSPSKIRSFRPIRENEVSSMIAGIRKKANSNEVIDVGEVVTSFNSNVLCRVAFGKKLDESCWIRFQKNISRLLGLTFVTFIGDCLVFGWMNKLFGFTRVVEDLFKEMDSFYQQLIDEHMDPDRPESMSNDILDLLIQLKEDHSTPFKFHWKHIKAIVMNVFMAGTDTTGVSLIWAMTSLMKNPNAMRKVQEEIRSLVGEKGSVDEDDIEKLPYLKAVVKETLRLYPPITLIPKETIEACVIDGFEIEANTRVIVNTWGICRDPEYWENADEFWPERFLNASFDHKGQQFEFIPFGSGRRICPGATLAITNMEVALANLIYFCNWEIPYGKTEQYIDTDATLGLVLHKKNPLFLLPKIYN